MIFKNKKALIDGLGIQKGETILDVGFAGQGIQEGDPNWPHLLLKQRSDSVYGLDLDFDAASFPSDHYQKTSAENFDFPVKFDLIFAGDIIEHLSNCGLFLDSCKRNLKSDGMLVLTTPNAFNLFNLAEKFTKYEPTVNSDHTYYFNRKTIQQLLEKNGWQVRKFDYVYSLEYTHQESLKKKFLNLVYGFFSLFTDKFTETMVVIAEVA